MAGSQDSALALAVCEAGGLGSLPAAMLNLETLAQELAVLKAQARGPYNANFFCHTPPAPDAAREQRWRAALAPHYVRVGLPADVAAGGSSREPFGPAALAVLAACPPPVVSFHFGLPAPALLAEIKSWGTTVLSSATTVDEARWLVAHGVDAIIAQGLEAGGHRGHFLSDDLGRQLGTLALLPQVVRAVPVPVIAAGGIADAAGVAAAQALGAAGVQVGTAYLLCDEARTAPLHRQALLAQQGPQARHTVLTNVFTGRPARGIVNALIEALGPISAEAPAFPLAAGAVAPLRAAAETQGSSACSPLWSGQNASGCRAVPAAEITRALATGWR
jgi:nitronate monooxygenase